MTLPADDLPPRLDAAVRDAVIHRAYLFALQQPDADGRVVSPSDALAMTVAYIQAQALQLRVELPDEPTPEGDDWKR